MNFEKEIKFVPSIMGFEIKFYLKGEKGIIQFCIATGWDEECGMNKESKCYAYDVGCHSPTPLYDDQKSMPENSCPFYNPCYYDGSSMYAKDVFRILIKYGHDGVWRELEKTYQRWLENNET